MTLPRAIDGAEHAYHLYVVRSERELPIGRGYYRMPVHRQPAIARRTAELPGTEEAARTNFALPMGTDLTEEQVREVVGVRVWVDLTNSPHVLVMRPLIEAMRADGHEVEVTARDFAQTLELCERFGIEHTADRPPPRRAARRARRSGSCSRSGGARRAGRAGARFDVAMGHGSNDVTVAAALLRIPGATAFDYEWAACSTTSTAGSAVRSSCPRRSRRSASPATARRGKLRRYAGLKEEYYLADFEPTEAVLDELGLDRARPLVVVRTPPEVSLYHRFENPLFRRVLERLRGSEAQAVVLPRTPRAARGAAGGGALRRARARDRRAEPGRARGPGRSRPAAP